jgi:hypothetical protein
MAHGGGPVGRHPAPARAREPRDHVDHLQGIHSSEIIATVHSRSAPVIPASAALSNRT